MELKEASKLAVEMMVQHGLMLKGWDFAWDRAVKRFGATHYRSKTITLSPLKTARMSEEEVRQIMLHEIAHALLPYDVGHGQEWKTLAAKIGYTGERLGVSDFDRDVLIKSARRIRRKLGGPEDLPPMRQGGDLFFKGKTYTVHKVNRKNAVCEEQSTKRRYNIPLVLAELCMIS